jgi:hypothetical protein
MPVNKSRLKSELPNAEEKAALLAKVSTLYIQRTTRLAFQIGAGPRFDASEATAVTFDPNAPGGEDAIIFQRPSNLLAGGGKEATRITTVADAGAKAIGTLNLTNDIIVTSVLMGTGRNTNTFTLQVAAAAANPSDTVLADFTGTAAAIVCTVTPNDGTNNGATPVNLTTAELVELINTGAVSGKTVTVTDGSGFRDDQTATGGGAENLADAGEGDGALATFAGGAASNLNSKYFTASAGNNAEDHYFYMNVNGEGVDPAVAAHTGHAVAAAAGASASAVAAALQAAIDGLADFDATVSGAAIVVQNADAGYATDTADGAAPTGFSFETIGQLETYDLADIVMIKRLRNKKWLIKLNEASDPEPA